MTIQKGDKITAEWANSIEQMELEILRNVGGEPTFQNKGYMHTILPFGATKEGTNPIYQDSSGDVHWFTVLWDGPTCYMLYTREPMISGLYVWWCVATSEDGEDFTKVAEWRSDIEWAIDGLEPHSVIKVGSEFYVYCAINTGTGWEVGLTKTTDLADKTKYSVPATVLNVGAGGQWDDTYATDPRVCYRNGQFYLYYIGHDGVWANAGTGLATATDGETFSKNGGNPLVGVGAGGSWDENRHLISCLIPSGSGVVYVCQAWDGADEVRNFLTCSADGVTFTKWYKEVLAKGAADSYDDERVVLNTVLRHGNDLCVYYQGVAGVGYTDRTVCLAQIEDYF